MMMESLVIRNRTCRAFDNGTPIPRETMVALVDLALLTHAEISGIIEWFRVRKMAHDARVEKKREEEELNGMFEAKNIDFATIEGEIPLNEGSAFGRGFAVAGGVAKAVTDLVAQEHPDLEVKTARAEGLRDCRKLMLMAKAGKYNGYLLEGMGCPGGCVAGAGTLLPVDLAAKVVGRYQSEAVTASPMESPYRDRGETLD